MSSFLPLAQANIFGWGRLLAGLLEYEHYVDLRAYAALHVRAAPTAAPRVKGDRPVRFYESL